MIQPSYHYITAANIMVCHEGQVHTLASGDPNFAMVRRALEAGDYEAAMRAINLESTANAHFASTDSDYRVSEGVVYFRDKPLRAELNQRVLDMVMVGADMSAMTAFLERLINNTSSRVQEQLYAFLQANNLPILEDGRFVVFKRIRDDWTDVHSRSIDNSVGRVVEMERSQVDDDPSRTCSHGLHVCSVEYLRHFSGERLVSCAVDPADVVSVPYDYNGSKMRVCRYEVLNELPMSIITNGESPWQSHVVDSEGRDLFDPTLDDPCDDWDDETEEEWEIDEDEGDQPVSPYGAQQTLDE